MKQTKKLLLPTAISCAIAGFATPAAFAQTDVAEPALEEVVVTGIRASLINSMAIKEDSSSIVEAISPEDIGKLPDTSIAESLARLPGLAGERRDGRTSGISVRGFNENYVATTMNGRELLGIGDNRGVEYDLYPSEIVAGAVVYKTPDASLINQGLGGIVDLRTRRPLESDRIISFNGSYEMNGLESGNPDFDDTGHRLALTYSDTFADDSFGLAVTVATMESPSQEEQVRAWGYADVPQGVVGVPAGTKILGGHDTFVRSALMERDTISAVGQYAPNDRLTFTVDALYIDFEETKVFRGLEEGGPVWGGANWSATSTEDGLVTAGQWDGFHSVIRNDGEVKDGDLSTFGFNVEYMLNSDWTLTFDAAHSESTKDLINMESYSGVGRAETSSQGDPAARTWVMDPSTGVQYSAHPGISMPDYADADVIRLAGPQPWGGAIGPQVGGNSNAQDGFVNNPSFEEELDTLRLSANGEIDFSIIDSIEVGVAYSDRSKSKVNYGAFLVAPGYDDSLPADQQTDIAVPDQYIEGVANLDFLGLDGMLAYDGIGMYRDGLYREIDATKAETSRLGDTYSVSEEVFTAYGMANFSAGIMSGNIGLQVVSSDQSSTGFDTYTGTDGFVVAIPVTGGADYTNVLPSLNTSFQVTDNQVVRFAAAKTMSRARMDEMKPNNSTNFSFDDQRRLSDDPEFSAWDASKGTPGLKPIEAVQADLSYEYYFADDGYVAAAYFYKDLQNWHLSSRALTDFTSFVVPGYHDQRIGTLVSTEGYTETILEAGDGYVKGTELQGSLPFHIFSDWLDGFGIIASATFLDGQVEYDGAESDIPGLSDEIYQVTVFYEKNGFEFRVSGRKRDQYLTEFYGASLALTPTTDQGAELIDAQIGFDFGAAGIESLDGLTLTLQGQNLTDEETISAAEDDPRQVNKYQHFGANYLLGVNYKF
ncbi:TonB-dependent receptor [Gilvimarinus agarilyticus]|uniref:TonB-dependent receptor n=1 Tax=Gilvimarinus agarilyticus TaxID=679259 RepID=UPI0005A003AF|nr:TonB-dependent receptor [Gilvimarinus agarilyticus]